MSYVIKDTHGLNRIFSDPVENEYPDQNSMVRVFKIDANITCQIETFDVFYTAYFLDNTNEPFLKEDMVCNARKYPRDIDKIVLEHIKQKYNDTHTEWSEYEFW